MVATAATGPTNGGTAIGPATGLVDLGKSDGLTAGARRTMTIRTMRTMKSMRTMIARWDHDKHDSQWDRSVHWVGWNGRDEYDEYDEWSNGQNLRNGQHESQRQVVIEEGSEGSTGPPGPTARLCQWSRGTSGGLPGLVRPADTETEEAKMTPWRLQAVEGAGSVSKDTGDLYAKFSELFQHDPDPKASEVPTPEAEKFCAEALASLVAVTRYACPCCKTCFAKWSDFAKITCSARQSVTRKWFSWPCGTCYRPSGPVLRERQMNCHLSCRMARVARMLLMSMPRPDVFSEATVGSANRYAKKKFEVSINGGFHKSL